MTIIARQSQHSRSERGNNFPPSCVQEKLWKISSGEIKVRCVSTLQIYYNGLCKTFRVRRKIQMKPPRERRAMCMTCSSNLRHCNGLRLSTNLRYGSLVGSVSSCYSFKREASQEREDEEEKCEENIVNEEKFKSATWNISYYPLISSLLCASVLSLYL